MGNVLVMGNSHMAALNRILPTSNTGRAKIHVLAKGNDVLLRSLSFKGELLHCDDPEIVSMFPELGFDPNGDMSLSGFSDVVVYGCQLWTKGKGNNWLKFVKDIESRKFSSAVLMQAFMDENRNTSHYDFFARWAEQCTSKARLHAAPSPLPSELSPDVPDTFNDFASVHAEKAMEAIFAPLNVKFHNINRELLAKNGYSVDSKYKSSREEDFIHLNDDGSRIVLRTMLDALGYGME